MSRLHALLIGIDGHEPDHFPDGERIPQLAGAVNDAWRMRDLLVTGPPKLSEERVRVLVSPSPYSGRSPPAPEDLPTLDNIRRELVALGDTAAAGDQVLVHFSGHGARVPSRSPAPKWEVQWDECLVPCDAGVSGYLRDWEIHGLLHALADLGLRPVVILDCCHSGGSFRGSAVRGITPAWPGPPDPGEPRIVRAAGPTRNTAASAGWWPSPPGSVLLAACRPTQLARESIFPGVGASGALTHHLLRATATLGPCATYRNLHRILLARIHGQLPSQTPVLEGDVDLRFLGVDHWPGLRGVPVMASDRRDGKPWVRLATGLSQGVSKGARFDLHPPGTADGEPGGRGEAEVVEEGGCASWARARLDSHAGDLSGWTAVLVDPGPAARVQRVAFHPILDQGGRPGGRADHLPVLDQVRTAIARGSRPWLELAEEGGADFGVAWHRDRGLVVVDPAGEPLPLQGRGVRSADELLDRLSHLARFAAVRALENGDHSSILRDALRLELWHRRSGAAAGAPESGPLGPEDAIPCGDEVELRIRNRSALDLQLAVLDVQPDWGVSQVHPTDCGAVSLGPGEESVARLVVELPPEAAECRDLLKVIATREPVDFSWLALPALDASGPTVVRRSGDSGEPASALEELFAQLTTDRPVTRTSRTRTPAGGDWTVAEIELHVVRRPGAGAEWIPGGLAGTPAHPERSERCR